MHQIENFFFFKFGWRFFLFEKKKMKHFIEWEWWVWEKIPHLSFLSSMMNSFHFSSLIPIGSFCFFGFPSPTILWKTLNFVPFLHHFFNHSLSFWLHLSPLSLSCTNQSLKCYKRKRKRTCHCLWFCIYDLFVCALSK